MWKCLLVCVSVAACGDDAPQDSADSSSSTGAGSSSEASTSAAGSSSESSGGPVDTSGTESSTTSSSSGSESSSDDGSSSSSGEIAMCGDGVIDPGVYCPLPVAVDGVESGGRGIVAADIDEDGDIDLVTTSQVLFNDGNGAFSVEDPFLASPEPSHLAVGDLGNDGNLDVVVPLADGIDVRLGNGDGSFAAGTVLGLDGEFGYAAAIGELGGDFGDPGLPDIAVGTLNGTVQIWEAIADGWAGNSEFPPGAGEIRDTTIVDLDGDGIGELLASDYYAGLLVRAADEWVAHPVFAAYLQIAVGDLDGDGALDVVGAMGSESGLQIQFGDGANGFADSTLIELTITPRSVGIGDFDNDGIVDVVAISIDGPPGLALARGTGDGAFAEAEMFEAPCGGYDLAVAELDGDDALDVAIYCEGPGKEGGPGVGLVLSDP